MEWGLALLPTPIAPTLIAGCIMPGQTPAVGDAVQMLGSCGPEGLIDDFEDDNNQSKVVDGRGGYWYTFADEAGTQLEPEAGGALRPVPGGSEWFEVRRSHLGPRRGRPGGLWGAWRQPDRPQGAL